MSALTLKDSKPYQSILEDLSWLDRNIRDYFEQKSFAKESLQPIADEVAKLVDLVSTGQL